MYWARFAPELSATVTMVRSWIIADSPERSLGALDEPHEAPPLVLRHRPRLHEADRIAHATFVLLVVHLELRALTDVTTHRRMLDEALDAHDHGLVHAVAHH